MSANKSKVLNILEMRYDYQSSRNVLNNWRKAANIRNDSETLNDEDLKSLLAYLKENAADAARVHSAIERMILSEKVEEIKAPVVEEVKEDAPVVEEVKEDAPVAEEVKEDAPAADDAKADDAKAEDAPADNGKKKKKAKH